MFNFTTINFLIQLSEKRKNESQYPHLYTYLYVHQLRNENLCYSFCTEILFAKEIIMLPDGHTCALFQHYQSFFLDTYIS